MPDPKPEPVTLPASAVTDLYAFLAAADNAADHTTRCDELMQMAGYLRAALDRATGVTS